MDIGVMGVTENRTQLRDNIYICSLYTYIYLGKWTLNPTEKNMSKVCSKTSAFQNIKLFY